MDGDGQSSIDTASVLVGNPTLAAEAAGPYACNEGGSVTLNGSAVSPPAGLPLTFAWDLDGDGAFDDALGPTAAFLSAADGTYSVRGRQGERDGRRRPLRRQLAAAVRRVAAQRTDQPAVEEDFGGTQIRGGQPARQVDQRPRTPDGRAEPNHRRALESARTI